MNEIDKNLTRLAKKTQIVNIRNERGNITIDCTNIKHITREQYEHLYINKSDKLGKWSHSLKDTDYQN